MLKIASACSGGRMGSVCNIEVWASNTALLSFRRCRASPCPRQTASAQSRHRPKRIRHALCPRPRCCRRLGIRWPAPHGRGLHHGPAPAHVHGPDGVERAGPDRLTPDAPGTKRGAPARRRRTRHPARIVGGQRAPVGQTYTRLYMATGSSISLPSLTHTAGRNAP